MGSILQTSNTQHTSLLVAEQLPDFVRDDHPVFVTFIEKYYEFLSNNTLMQVQTSAGDDDVYYYGAEAALKIIPDIGDIDTTDFSQFIQSFRKQYAPTLPERLGTNTNVQTLYKNLINFYQSVGTEDSFKTLFRLLYNEEIEIYYPKDDLLIASGGDWRQQVRIKVLYVDDLGEIENKKIVGANSGAYGTVEKIKVLPVATDEYVSGQIANTATLTNTFRGGPLNTAAYSGANGAGVSNSQIYDSHRVHEELNQQAFVYMTVQSGTFDFF